MQKLKIQKLKMARYGSEGEHHDFLPSKNRDVHLKNQIPQRGKKIFKKARTCI